jgi:hypothetical protein
MRLRASAATRGEAMTIKQISLFLENKPGHLKAICRTLADARINIVTLSLADTQQFGIVRLIVEEWERAQQILEQAGYIVNVRDVVAATVRDEPGGIEYMYAFAFRRGEEAVLVFRFDNAEKAIAALKASGNNVLGSVDLFQTARHAQAAQK